uniref:Uncharacterized protein n=1 Tax=Rhizophora mucronata TaxID=61149 RepID=A0A2P2KA92_RHIMU
MVCLFCLLLHAGQTVSCPFSSYKGMNEI